jgi:hypothetical protein
MFRTLTGKEARHHRNTLRWHRHMVRLDQSRKQVDLYWEGADWDKCLRAFMDNAPMRIIHKGGKPRGAKRRYTAFD